MTTRVDTPIVLSMKSSTHRIPASRLAELEKRIAKINKRAAKLEVEPVSLEVGATESVTVTQGGSLALRMGTKYTYDAVNVTLTGETPKLNGWEFIATVLHKPAGNEFVAHTNNDDDLSGFVFADRDCDHCHKLRIRNATYIVRNDEGDLKQVGSTCLGDFTGYHSPEAAAKALENIYKLFVDVASWGTVAGRTTKKFFLEEYLAFVAQTIRTDGWVSKAKANDQGGTASAYVAKHNILQAGEGGNVAIPTDADFDKAREVIQWVRDNADELDLTDGFIKQLVAIYASDGADVSEWEMARAAAGFTVMWKAEKERKQATDQATQEYFGAIGDKLNLILKVERIGKGWSSDYGWTTPINFTDAQGRHFAWFCTGKGVDYLEAGKTYEIRGTVKRQEVDTYTGNKTTYLNRCKVGQEVATATPAVDPMDIIRKVLP